MPSVMLRSEFQSEKQLVLITGLPNSYKNNLTFQLEGVSGLKTIFIDDNEISRLQHLEPRIIVHFVGFHPLSYTSVYSATVYLHALLQTAYIKRARLILVVANSQTTDSRAAIALASQHSRNFGTRYDVIDINNEADPVQAAKEIASAFIYKHKPKNTVKTDSTVNSFLFNQKFKKNHQQTRMRNLSRFIILGAFLLLGLYLYFFFQLILGISFFKNTARSFIDNNYVNSINYARLQNALLAGADFQSRFLPGTRALMDSLRFSSQSANNLSSSLKDVSEKVVSYENIIFSVFNNSRVISQDSPRILSSEINYLSQSISLATSLVTDYYKDDLGQLPSTMKLAQKLDTLENHARNMSIISPLFSDFMGFNTNSTWLFLLYDNSTPFATGGIISSAVILNIKEGRVINSEFFEASNIDKLLPGKIESPTELKRLTSETYWPFSKSSWEPDYSVSAVKSAWFVNQALNINPDVVVGINPIALKALLKAVGPLTLSAGNDTLTHINFSETYTRYLNDNRVSEFYNRLVFSLSSGIEKLSQNDKTRFYQAIIETLHKRQIFIYPLSISPALVNSAGFSGGIRLPSCKSYPNCFQDYIYLNDSGLSPDPLGFRLSFSHKLELSLSRGQLVSLLNSTVNNPSPQPSSLYRRIYLPANVSIDVININGRKIIPESIRRDPDSGLLQLGILIETPAGSQSVLEIGYRRNMDIKDRKFHLSVLIPNQPGIENSTLNIKINYPPDWFATSYQNPLVASPGTLGYNTSYPEPFNLDIDFSPK